MKITKLFLSLAMVGMIFISGCNNMVDITNPVVNDNLIENTPAIVNKQDTFTFAVKAKNYNQTFEHTLTFNSKTIEVALAIGGYSLGKVDMEIYNEANNKIFQGNYTKGIALVEGVSSETFPSKIHLTLTNVSASVSLAVKTK